MTRSTSMLPSPAPDPGDGHANHKNGKSQNNKRHNTGHRREVHEGLPKVVQRC